MKHGPHIASHLFAAVDKLVAAIFGEVILCECLAAVLKLFACSIFVLLWNAVRQSILKI